jgi:hypothetical protein
VAEEEERLGSRWRAKTAHEEKTLMPARLETKVRATCVMQGSRTT